MKRIIKFVTLSILFSFTYSSIFAQCVSSASYFELRLVNAQTAPTTDYIVQMRYNLAGPPDYGSDPSGASSLCSTIIPNAGGATPSYNGGMVFSISWNAATSPTYVPTSGTNPSGGANDNNSGLEFALNPFSFVKGFGVPQLFGGKYYQDYGDGAAAVNGFGTWADGQWYNMWRISTQSGAMASGDHPQIVAATDPWFASVPNGCPYIAQLDASNIPICEAGFKAANTTVLPITLVSFDAVKIKNTTVLNWTTNLEENFSHFEIERSADGIHFGSNLGSIFSKSTSNLQKNEYSFTDKTPMSKHNYYRLKCVDQDGKYVYSQIIHLYHDLNNSISVYPNPSQDEISIDVDVVESSQVSINILDLLGKVERHTEHRLEKGKNYIPISLDGLQPGFYFVKMENGKSIHFNQSILKL